MANKIVRNITEVKDVNKLAQHVTTQNDLIQTTDGSVYVVTKNGYEKITSGLSDSEITALKNSVSDLEKANDEQDTKVSELEKAKDEQAKKVSELETTNSEQDTKISDLEKANDEQDTKISDLEKAKDKQDTKISDLTSRIEGLETPVTGVTVAQDAHDVEVEGTTQIKPTVKPSDATDKKVSYKSSDDKVATVDDKGKVTGVKAGSAEITVTTNDGSKTAKCTLTVTENEEPTE